MTLSGSSIPSEQTLSSELIESLRCDGRLFDVEGLDLYLTGEAEEWTKAQAEELGVAFIAGGHHRTERFGPKGIARHLAEQGIDARFIDVSNPV